MTRQERQSRIIARGEHSNHSHVVTGDAVVINNKGEITIEVGKEGAVLEHILESNWMDGQVVWTQEHKPIDLSEMPDSLRQGDVYLKKIGERTYKFTQQIEFDPFEKIIRQVVD